MPSINDLKKNSIHPNTMDINKNIPTDDSVTIDMTSASGIQNSINHNEAVYNNSPKGKTIVNAPNRIKRADGTIVNLPPKRSSSSSEGRVAFDITKLPKGDENTDDIHTSIEDDILSGKNPILYNYIAEKKAEMENWVAEKEDERELKLANGEIKQQEDEVNFDITAPSTIEATESNDASSNNNQIDELSFEKYENTTKEDINIKYDMVDDVLDELENSNAEDTVEVIEENNDEDILGDSMDNIINDEDLNEEEQVDIIDDIPDDIDKIVEAEIAVDTIDDNIEDDTVEEVDVDTLTATDNAKEVDDTPEEDKFVSSEGISFQDTDGLKQEAISIEAEEDEAKTESNSAVGELDEKTKYIIAEASKVLKSAAKKIDISSYTVVKKPGNTNRFFNQKHINVAKWVLRTKKVCVHMKASQGAELEELRTLMTEANTASDFIRMYRIIYDHIASPKPNSFEAWCKSTYTDDLDDYFFCFFIANYKGSNYIPYDCTNKDCTPGSFLSDNIPIMNMVKFGSDKDKAEFSEIYKSEAFDVNDDGLYAVERVPFSDKVAIGFKENTLYSFIEAQSIRNNEQFITKYSGAIALAPNIDDIYIIDEEHHSLYPVQYKVYPDSNANTYKSKIQKYDSILKSLDPDEFATLTTYINTFTSEKKRSINMKYIRPAAKCPNCGTEIPEADTTAQSLVFFRYQLGQMVNISTK